MKSIVTLSDPVITVTNWPAQLGALGTYKLRLRKTQEEMRAERESLKKLTGNPRPKVNPNKFQYGTVIKQNPDKPDTVHFLPGLWPRVRQSMDKYGIQYDIVDKRDMSIRPQIDFDAIKDVQFRPTQDLALALVANSDCGIIETTTAWGKCVGKETNVYDGAGWLVNITSLHEGDPITGWDAFSGCEMRRKITKLTTGREMLYRYTSEEGVTYRFTGDHTLVLMPDEDITFPDGDVRKKDSQVFIKVLDYIGLPDDIKKHLFAVRVCGPHITDCNNSWSHRWMREDIDKFDAFRTTYIPPQMFKESLVLRINVFLRYMAKMLGKRKDLDWTSTGVVSVDVYYESFAKDFVRLIRMIGLKAVYSYVKDYYTITIYGNNLKHFQFSAGLNMRGDIDSMACDVVKKLEPYVPMRFEIVEDQVDDWVGFELGPIEQSASDQQAPLETLPLFPLEDYTLTHNSFLISVICRAFPTLNIVVCTSSASVVGTLYEYLQRQLPGEIGCICGGRDTSSGKRIVVSTLKSLLHVQPTAVQLLLADECHDIGATKSGQDIMQFCFARKFGFSASPKRNDGSQIVMESLFGPTILKMSYDDAVQAGMVTPMKYVMLPCHNAPPFDPSTAPDFLRKRLGYWVNAARNRAIRDLVYDVKQVSDCQTLIMVGTLEHAIRIHMELPWFKVVYYGASNMEDLQKHFPKTKYPNLDLNKYKSTQKQLEIARKAFSKGTLKYVISTFVFKQGIDAVHLRLLIRADGTTSEVAGIQIPGRLSRLDKDKEYAYLVDFDDTFNPWAKNRAISRKEQYDKQGWTQITREQLINDFRQQALVDGGGSSGEGATEPER